MSYLIITIAIVTAFAGGIAFHRYAWSDIVATEMRIKQEAEEKFRAAIVDVEVWATAKQRDALAALRKKLHL